MRTLTVRQPYALMLVTGNKDFEFRSWPLPEKHWHKPIRIHASAKEATEVIGCTEEKFEACIRTARENGLLCAISGEVTFGRPVRTGEKKWAWPVIDRTVYVKPIRNIKGRLGIWKS